MRSTLLEDNEHWVNSDAYSNFVSRDILTIAQTFLETKEVLALIGARRVGKSTLAKLLIRYLLNTVSAKNIFFINLEKPEFIPYKEDASYLNKIYNEYLKITEPDLSKKIYFFIDEVQIFHNWEIFVKAKYENSNIKFIITGSNSSLLKSNYATYLTGRVLKLQVHSFSFVEFLRYKNILASTILDRVNNQIAIARAIDEYLQWGGYYAVISNSSETIKKEQLKNIAEDIILKDIVPRYKIKNSQAIRDLFYYVVSNAASQLNYATLARKIGIDAKMIKEYLGYFADNYLISFLPKYHNKLTEQINSKNKLYLSDNGFLNLGVNRTKNQGIRLENLVFNFLYQQDEKLTYLLDKYEVDFYSQNMGDHNTLYQVAYNIEDTKTQQRELKSLEHFRKKGEKCKLVTYDFNLQLDDIDAITITELFFDTVST